MPDRWSILLTALPIFAAGQIFILTARVNGHLAALDDSDVICTLRTKLAVSIRRQSSLPFHVQRLPHKLVKELEADLQMSSLRG